MNPAAENTSLPLDPRWLALPAKLDLTRGDHLEQVQVAADAIGDAHGTPAALAAFEATAVARKHETPLGFQLAVKLARSRAVVKAATRPGHVSVVFAVYREHNRIRRAAEHRNGEDFLRRKLAQLGWLFDRGSPFTWDLYLVDDGCPQGSGRIAEEILADHPDRARAHVLFLEDAIRAGVAVTRPMTSAADSQKGGAIHYGMWAATQAEHADHIVVFTDADLSTHLGQTGLLVDGILNHGKRAAIGSRREPASVVVKQGTRNDRGKLFIYVWKRLIHPLAAIVDTQCGFKAFRADTAREVIRDAIEKRFAFDIELLLKTELVAADSIRKVPVAWIDSEAESTTTDIQPYLSMLQSVARMYRRYLPANPEADAFADLVEGLDEAGWDRLVAAIPAAITEREPATFDTFRGVSAAELRVTACGLGHRR